MARRRCARCMTRPISLSCGPPTRTGARPGARATRRGYAWPVVRRRPLALDRIDAKLGAYSFDASSPIAAGTWEGAYWSAQTALTALDAVLAGERAAFALCRPPGHHAGRDYLGGYCYLNNAADRGRGRRRGRASGWRSSTSTIITATAPRTSSTDARRRPVRLDPRRSRGPTIPIIWGHADETGEGDGEGATLNLPLPRGTGLAAYLPALDTALAAHRRLRRGPAGRSATAPTLMRATRSRTSRWRRPIMACSAAGSRRSACRA